MGLLDRALSAGKERAVEAATKAKEFAVEHRDQVKGGIDKAEELADKATKGRYRDKIHKVGERADGAVDKLAEKSGDKPAEASGVQPADEPAEASGETSAGGADQPPSDQP